MREDVQCAYDGVLSLYKGRDVKVVAKVKNDDSLKDSLVSK